jgi:hypothetical protein
VARLQQSLTAPSAATNALPSLNEELQALRSEAQQQAAAWRAEVARLQQSLTAPSAATNALPSLNEELQALRSEAQQQAAAWRAEAERLQRALAAQATTAAGAPDVREEIRKEAAASAARLEGLSQQLAALRGRWEEQSNQVRRVEATVQEASARAAGESAAGLAALNQRLTEWRTDVDRRAGQADSATREMQAAVEGLRQAQAALRAQLESQPAPTESLPAARLAEWRTALEAQTTALRGMMEIRLRDLEGAEAELRDALSVLQRQPDLRPALDALNARVEGLERARRDPPPTVDAAALAGRFEPLGQNWRLRGNTDTLPGQDFLGTTDAAPLEFRVENRPALRLTAGAEAPNLIGGHAENAALQRNGVAIAGGGAPGQPNRATGNHAAIGGGLGNEAALMATVGGGAGNLATGVTSTIAGGYSNRASEAFASIGGGAQNIADGRFARIGGGALNRAPGTSATVGGGRENQASGEFSSVPGGRDNLASAPYAQAAGRRAKAIHPGSFVWADATDEDALSERPNHLLARATGGVTLRTAPGPSGVELPPGGNAWSMLSRRDAKENFAPADTEAILRKVGELPLAEWNLRSQPAAIRHLGPVAEDFHAAFGLGESADRIHAGDADGVALAAIQALLRRNERLERELAELRQQVQRLQETRP